MSTKEIDIIAKKIKTVIERMSLELYKKKPDDIVNKIYNENINKYIGKIYD